MGKLLRSAAVVLPSPYSGMAHCSAAAPLGSCSVKPSTTLLAGTATQGLDQPVAVLTSATPQPFQAMRGSSLSGCHTPSEGTWYWSTVDRRFSSSFCGSETVGREKAPRGHSMITKSAPVPASCAGPLLPCPTALPGCPASCNLWDLPMFRRCCLPGKQHARHADLTAPPSKPLAGCFQPRHTSVMGSASDPSSTKPSTPRRPGSVR